MPFWPQRIWNNSVRLKQCYSGLYGNDFVDVSVDSRMKNLNISGVLVFKENIFSKRNMEKNTDLQALLVQEIKESSNKLEWEEGHPKQLSFVSV